MASKSKKIVKSKNKKTDATNGLWIAPRYISFTDAIRARIQASITASGRDGYAEA
jgi:hypothetical protein